MKCYRRCQKIADAFRIIYRCHPRDVNLDAELPETPQTLDELFSCFRCQLCRIVPNVAAPILFEEQERLAHLHSHLTLAQKRKLLLFVISRSWLTRLNSVIHPFSAYEPFYRLCFKMNKCSTFCRLDQILPEIVKQHLEGFPMLPQPAIKHIFH